MAGRPCWARRHGRQGRASAAHLPALSTRLPTISSMSCRSPRKRGSGSTSPIEGDRAVAVDLGGCPQQAVDMGATAVAAPTDPARAAARARSRYQFTWSRMMAACSRTFSPSGPAFGPASLMMTLSGVFSAWARLPTWVRARSRISRFEVDQQVHLGGKRRDVFGNSPSTLSAWPRRMAPTLGRKPRRAAAGRSGPGTAVVAASASPSRPKVSPSAQRKLRWSPRSRRRRPPPGSGTGRRRPGRSHARRHAACARPAPIV